MLVFCFAMTRVSVQITQNLKKWRLKYCTAWIQEAQSMSNRLDIGLKFIHLCCQSLDTSGAAVLLSCFSRFDGETERLYKTEERKNPSFHPRAHCNGTDLFRPGRRSASAQCRCKVVAARLSVSFNWIGMNAEKRDHVLFFERNPVRRYKQVTTSLGSRTKPLHEEV